MPTRDPRRRVRATLIGVALAALTLAGHTVAGGSVHGVGIALVGILSVAFGSVTSAGRLRPLLILGVLIGGQALLHTLLTLTAAHAHGGSETALPGAGMATAHVLAAILATGLIAFADRIAAAWFAFLAVVLGRDRLVSVGVTGRRKVGATDQAPRVPGSDFLSGLLLRRGPPAGHPALCTQ